MEIRPRADTVFFDSVASPSGIKTQPCVMQLQPVLTAWFVYCPPAGTPEWDDRVCGRDPDDKNGMKVTGLCFEEVHSTATFGPMSAKTELCVFRDLVVFEWGNLMNLNVSVRSLK
ncbi:Hypothetical predicted protein [Xyrichtys novacula]|uniref:Uncharacterized protein n=1 Tax=Xyrichtys novacula TaxID=13765 RepID=A0AAV1FWH4_XYRNO|nr:Hypothetical predicted protein [Xyrichtys novacula]